MNGKTSTIQSIKDILKRIREQAEAGTLKAPPVVPEAPVSPRLISIQERLAAGKDVFLPPGTASEIGLPGDFPMDWLLKISPGRNGDEPTFLYHSPEGLDFEEKDIRLSAKGEWLSAAEMEEIRSGKYLAYHPGADKWLPTTKSIVEAREEAGLTIQELEELASEKYQGLDVSTGKMVPTTAEGVRQREDYYFLQATQLGMANQFKDVFPDLFGMYKGDELVEITQAYADAIGQSEQSQQQFFEAIQAEGSTPDTERLLNSLIPGLKPKDFDEFFKPETLGAITTDGDFIKQGFFESFWDAIQIGSREFVHKSEQWFYTVLAGKLSPEYGVDVPIPEELKAHPEVVARINERNLARRDELRATAADKQRVHNEWIEAHPELQPPAHYRKDVTQNLDLLAEPGYWGHVIGEAATFSLAILGTILGTTFVTKNPYIGIAAGTAVATPLQSQDLYEDLISSGAPQDEALNIAIPIGMVIAMVEAVTDLPLLKAISPAFDLLHRGIKKNVVDRTMAALAKKGIITFTTIEVVEVMEEVVQGAIQDAFVKQYDENRQMFANVDEIAIKTLIATSPLAIFGGGMSMRHVSKGDAAAVPTEQKQAEGWQLDNNTGEWYKPEKMVDTYSTLVGEVAGKPEPIVSDVNVVDAIGDLDVPREFKPEDKVWYSYQAELESWQNKLSPLERSRVFSWRIMSTNIRDFQRMGSDPDNIVTKEFIEDFETAVEKAPVYKGIVYRGMTGLTTEQLEKLVSSKRITWPSTTSTSTMKGIAEQFAAPGGRKGKVENVLMEIELTTGRYTQPFPSDIGEVLTLPGTTYEIVSVESIMVKGGWTSASSFMSGLPRTRDFGATLIKMKEVAPMSVDEAKLKALSELARTPEGEEAIKLYHGTISEFKEFKGDVAYLTDEMEQAEVWAGEGVDARVINVDVVDVKAKDINDIIESAIVDEDLVFGPDIDVVIAREAETARSEGYNFMTFEHPGGTAIGALGGGESFTTYVSLYPQTLKINAEGEVISTGEPEVAPKVAPAEELAELTPEERKRIGKEQPSEAEVAAFLKKAGAEELIAKPAKLDVPTLINRVRAEHTEIQADVEALRLSIARQKDIVSRQTRLMLKGTERELAAAGALLDRVEAGETVTEAELAKARERLTAARELHKIKLGTMEQQKQALVDFAKTLPLEVRGKLLARVKNVKTEKGLARAITLAEKYSEKSDQKTLRTKIRTELKRAQVVIKDKITRGKFTPEVQRRIDVLTHNLDVDRNDARIKMAGNIQKFDDGDLTYEEMMGANEALRFAGIKGMSADELATMLEYVQELKAEGRSVWQAKREKDHEQMVELRTDISNTLTGGQGLKTGVGAVPRGELAAKTGWWDVFVNWQYGLDNLADKLSKLDRTSDPYQSALSKFVANAHRATIKQASTTKVQFDRSTALIKDIYNVKTGREVNRILSQLDEEVNLGVFELTEEYKELHPEAKDTFTLVMTRGEMVSKYMQIQDPTLSETFTYGMGWAQKVLDAVEANLTTREKRLAESVFEFYDDYYETTNKVYQEMYNVDLPYNPRYSPIRRDLEGDIRENVLTFADAMRFASTLNASLMARVKNRNPLKFNNVMDILANHITQMEHFKAWAETMRDFRRVFGNKQIRQAIEQYHGIGINRLMDKFMNQLARGGIETAATNRVADYLRRAFTKSILAVKPVIMPKQIVSMFAYMSEMSVVDFSAGIADYWSAPVKNFKFLWNNSEGFKSRVSQGHERDIRAALAKYGRKRLSGQGSFTDWFLLQIRAGDTFAVTQGMWARMTAELHRLGVNTQTASPEQLQQAVAAAEDLTGRTQPSFGIDSLSSIQNGGSWLKLMVMFQNQPGKYFRMIGDNLRNFKYGRGSRTKAASTILMAWVVLPMMFQFLADAFQWKPERELRAGLLGPLNYILIGGQLVQAVWGWLTDEPFDHQISPVIQTLDDLKNIVLKSKKLVNQGQDPYQDVNLDDACQLVEYLAKASGQVLGLPTPYIVQAERQVREAIQENEDIKVEHFLFSAWALEPPKKDAEGKVEEATLQLGQIPEKVEDKPLSDEPIKVYNTINWFRDMSIVYDNVLPSTVLDDLKASKESKAWAQVEQAKAQADILPNKPLYKINTEDDADTIINYYQQWKGRERIDNLPDLVEYDKLYPNARLGNVSRIQYSTLVKYLESEDKDVFLENHPELKANLRSDWLKANPTDNAYLSLSGDAKLLTIEAYNEFERLLKELDIPEDAIPDLTLPPKASAENYFVREEIVDLYGAQSAESLLILSKDPVLTDWYGFETPEQVTQYYELKVENRAEREYWEKLGDKDLPDVYIEDDDERRVEFFKKFPDSKFFDDNRRTEALSHDFTGEQVEAWVERGQSVDETSGNNPLVKLWAFKYPEAYAKAIAEDLVDDRGGLPDIEDRGLYEAWVKPSLELQVKNAEEDEHWGTLKDKESPETYIEDGSERREAFFKKFPNSEYFDDMERIEAYNVGFTKAEANLWAERGQLAIEFSPLSAEVRVWFADHPSILDKAFRNGLMESDGTDWNTPADRLAVKWRDEDEEYNAIDSDAANPDTGIRLRVEWLALPENEEYRKDRRRINFYQAKGPKDETFNSELVETYVEYWEQSIIGFRRERMFYDADGKLNAFGKQMHTIEGLDIIPFKNIPSAKYDDIYDQYKVQFNTLRGLGNNKSPYYVEDNITKDPETGRTPREQAAYDLRFNASGTLTDFGKAEIRRNGYGIFVPDNYIERFVEWQVIEKEGRPGDWSKDKGGNYLTWYEDDWYLEDHPGFYESVYLKHLGLTERKFNLVPAQEVFDKYVEYIALVPGKPREDFRFNNPDLEAWLLETKKVTQSIFDKRRRAGLTAKERMLEELKELEETLRRR